MTTEEKEELILDNKYIPLTNLFTAINNKNLIEVKLLLQDINIQTFIQLQEDLTIECYARYNYLPAKDYIYDFYCNHGARKKFFGAFNSNVEIVKYLYKCIVGNNIVNHSYDVNELCYLAAGFGTTDMINIFLENGADINALCGLHHKPPINLAVNWNKFDNVKFFLDKGVDSKKEYKSISNPCKKIAKLLIDHNSYATNLEALDYFLNRNTNDSYYSSGHFDEIIKIYKKYIKQMDNFNLKNNKKHIMDIIEIYDILQPLVKEKYIIDKILNMKYDMEFYDYN